MDTKYIYETLSRNGAIPITKRNDWTVINEYANFRQIGLSLILRTLAKPTLVIMS